MQKRRRVKGKQLLISFALFLLLAVVIFLGAWRISRKDSTDDRSKAAYKTTIPIRQTIVYEAPRWNNSGTALSPSEISSRFDVAIYARNQMKVLPDYLRSGYIGRSYVYLIMDAISGPTGLANISSQTTACTSAQKTVSVYSNNAAMDTGDFCEIHDAIVNHTALPDYPDIFPTEAWFLHHSDGSRYAISSSGGFVQYRPNPADANWQKYFARRALRELTLSDQSHLPVAQVTGLFIDNLDLSWSKLIRAGQGSPPKEFSSNDAYMAAVVDFIRTAYAELHQGNNHFPIFANMIEDPHTGSSWDIFLPYLDGGMNESFVLNWGHGPTSSAQLLKDMSQADKWISAGRTFAAVIQGNSEQQYAKYAYAVSALVTDGIHLTYKYANYAGSYSQYYEQPEYSLEIGMPIEPRQQITASPLVYQRRFECGLVTADLTNHQGSITINPGCTPGQSPSPTPTTTASPSPTPAAPATPTPTPSPTSTLLETELVLYPLADTYVDGQSQTKFNGSARSLGVDGTQPQIIYLTFDTSQAIGKTLRTAILEAYAIVPAAATTTQSIWSISNIGWSETGTNFTNRPLLDGQIVGNLHGGNRNSWISTNLAITSITSDRLTFAITTTDRDDLWLSSREVNKKPRLRLIFAN